MDKKHMKTIEIINVQVNHLSSSSDITGEWSSHYDIDFLLSESVEFSVFDKTYKIDRVKMSSHWDETILEYANENMSFASFDVSKVLVYKIYNKTIEEQKYGKLKGYGFDDSIMDILRGDSSGSRWM